MCAPDFPKKYEDFEGQIQNAQTWDEILVVLREILRLVQENQEEDSDSEEDENAAVIPQAPIRSSSGSLDGGPPPKRFKDSDNSRL